MVWFWLFALLLGVAAVVALVRHHRVAFVIAFQEAGPVVRKGTPPSGFLKACRDIGRMYRIRSGQVYGLREAGGLQLGFSRDLPERARQPLRNCWTPPPTGGPGGGARRAG